MMPNVRIRLSNAFKAVYYYYFQCDAPKLRAVFLVWFCYLFYTQLRIILFTVGPVSYFQIVTEHNNVLITPRRGKYHFDGRK